MKLTKLQNKIMTLNSEVATTLIKDAAIYAPELLVKKDNDGRTTFAVTYEDCKSGSASTVGILFNTTNSEGQAVCTLENTYWDASKSPAHFSAITAKATELLNNLEANAETIETAKAALNAVIVEM